MNLTKEEDKVLTFMADYQKELDSKGEAGFSDIMIEDIVGQTDLSVKSTRGVISSLLRKGLVNSVKVNDDYSIYSLTDESRAHFNMEPIK